MTSRQIITALLASACLTTAAYSDATSTPSKQDVIRAIDDFFTTAGRAGPATAPSEQRRNRRGDSQRAVSLVNEIKPKLEADRYEEAARGVRAAVGQFEDPALADAVLALSKQLDAYAAAQREALPAKYRGLVKSLPERIKAAQKPEDLDALKAEVRAASRALNNGEMPDQVRRSLDDVIEPLSRAENAISRYADLLAAENAGDFGQAQQIANNLRNDTGSREFGVLVQARIEAIQKRRDEADRATLDQFHQRALAATKPADVESLRQDLQSMVEGLQRRGDSGSMAQRGYMELQSIQLWSRLVDLESTGHYRDALQAIAQQRMSGQNGPATSIVTASMIDEKATALRKKIADAPDAIADPMLRELADGLASAKSLPDLEAVAKRGTAFMTGSQLGGNSVDDGMVVAELNEAFAQIRSLSEMNHAIDAHEWGRFFTAAESFNRPAFNNNNYGQPGTRNRWIGKLEAERLNLSRRAIVENADMAGLGVDLSKPDPLDRLLLAGADAAIASSDFRKAQLILQAYVRLIYGGGPDRAAAILESVRADLKGVELFAEAQSFDTASDLREAVVRYRQVLQLTGPRVPIERATKRLAEIAKEHPELLTAPAPDPTQPAVPTGPNYPRQ
ncbi:MAG: hypothetical protein QM770_16490 [Tepidisphaeraceae bacterium]